MVSRDDAVDDTNNDDGAHDLVYTTMLILPGEWYVFLCSRPLPIIPP
jgi:hypothetical protein